MVPQSLELLRRQLNHEVSWEAFEISLHGTIERLGLDAEKGSGVRIQNDAVATYYKENVIKRFDGKLRYVTCHDGMISPRQDWVKAAAGSLSAQVAASHILRLSRHAMGLSMESGTVMNRGP